MSGDGQGSVLTSSKRVAIFVSRLATVSGLDRDLPGACRDPPDADRETRAVCRETLGESRGREGAVVDKNFFPVMLAL